MKNRIAVPLLSSFAFLLAGCGGMSMSSLWPFDGGPEELSRTPANAAAYRCEGGKRLYVRYMDNGAYAWVILPEREFRLDKSADGQTNSYGNGKARLVVNGDEVTLSDGPSVSYTGCKPPQPPQPPKAPEAAAEKKS